MNLTTTDALPHYSRQTGPPSLNAPTQHLHVLQADGKSDEAKTTNPTFYSSAAITNPDSTSVYTRSETGWMKETTEDSGIQLFFSFGAKCYLTVKVECCQKVLNRWASYLCKGGLTF